MLTGRVARRFKCRLSPRGGPYGVLGDLPELEPGQPPVAAQHPYLAIKLAVTYPQGLGETPLGPSRALGCPWPNYKPRRGGGQARPRIHVHPARGPLHSRWRRASVPSTCIESEHADGPGRKRAAFALDDGPALLPHRHAIDANPVTTEPLDVGVLFFFTTRPSCTSRSRCPSRRSGSTAGRCSCCICG